MPRCVQCTNIEKKIASFPTSWSYLESTKIRDHAHLTLSQYYTWNLSKPCTILRIPRFFLFISLSGSWMFNFPGASGGFRGSCSSHNNRSPTLGHRRQKELSDTSRQDVAKVRLVITSQGVCWASTATEPVISSFSARQLDGNCNE